VGFEPTLERF